MQVDEIAAKPTVDEVLRRAGGRAGGTVPLSQAADRRVMAGPQDLAAAAAAHGVRDRRVLDALGLVPRARFVPGELVGQAYLDQPVPLAHGQVTTQPSLSAQMIAALELAGDERVFEVGTGYGYQTALLARLAGRVWTVERFAEFADAAERNLAALGVDNVDVVVGDGTLGLPQAAPFDAVLVSAAFPEVPAPLVQQLRPGGRLVQPVGPGGHDQVTSFRKHGGLLVAEAVVTPARFVRLTGRHGYPGAPL